MNKQILLLRNKQSLLLHNKKVLVVEDEPALLAVLVDKLTLEGFAVLSAKDGQEGLSSALKNHPDLILLDIIMPVMDGVTMLKKLRESGNNSRVIILTNLSSDGNKIINDGTVLEMSHYLVKADWRLEDLMTRIKEILVIEV